MADRKIVVVGSSNTDLIIQLAKIPRPGETLTGGRFSMAAGGKGANQAVAAARAGGKVVFVGRVGEDMFGQRALEGLVSDGIEIGSVFHDLSSPSGIAFIFVAESGENSIGVAPGSNAWLSVDDVRSVRSIISSAGTLLMQLETPLDAVTEAASIAASGGARVILNPAPARVLPDDLLRNVGILTPNETEAGFLTGAEVRDDADAVKAADLLRSRGVGTVIVTLGARGACVVSDGYRGVVPGFRVEAVDTTAAGDVFNGALAVALSEGRELPLAVRFACAAAAISVTRLGAQPSVPPRAEIEALLAASA
jgi:ribokinase